LSVVRTSRSVSRRTFLLDKLKARQERRAAVVATIEAGSAVDVQRMNRTAIERKLRHRLTEWQAVLGGRRDRTRQLLRKVLVSPIVLTADGDVYRFAGEVEFGVLLGEIGLATNLARPGRTRTCSRLAKRGAA
jgi:hypothetical protein